MKNRIKILKYIMILVSSASTVNGQNIQHNKILRIESNLVLSQQEKKEIFKVVDEVQQVQNKNIIKLQANAGADIIVKLDESFKLDASGSIGNIIGYEWKYKGNIISNMPIVNLAITKTGSFEMFLEVIDSNGEISTDTVIIDIESNATKSISISKSEGNTDIILNTKFDETIK